MRGSQIAIVTGGAKRIGKHISTHLAKCGYDIIMHYNSSEADNTIDAIRSHGRNVYPFKADLSEKSERKRFVDFCAEHQGIRLLINNAAIFTNDHIISPELEESLSRHLDINTIAPISIAQCIVSTESISKEFDIINILDYSIFKIPHNFFSYHLSKKILGDWTQLAARQLAPNIKVNGIALGQILRNTLQSIEEYNMAVNTTLLGCSGTVQEIEKTIDFILGVKSMTGQIICLDGGMHISDLTYR